VKALPPIVALVLSFSGVQQFVLEVELKNAGLIGLYRLGTLPGDTSIATEFRHGVFTKEFRQEVSETV